MTTKKKILIADDSGFMRGIIKNILQEIGYSDAIEAGTGKETLEKFKAEKPDLVLLDIIFPDIDGQEILKEILKLNSQAKVIMVTAVGQQPMMDACMKTGAKDYIVKPFEKSKIEEAVKGVLS